MDDALAGQTVGRVLHEVFLFAATMVAAPRLIAMSAASALLRVLGPRCDGLRRARVAEAAKRTQWGRLAPAAPRSGWGIPNRSLFAATSHAHSLRDGPWFASQLAS